MEIAHTCGTHLIEGERHQRPGGGTETQGHMERLEEIFEEIDKPARGKTCDAINGIIEEGKEIMEEFADTKALDPALLAAAQTVEHYEISRYGTLKTWAAQLSARWFSRRLLLETISDFRDRRRCVLPIRADYVAYRYGRRAPSAQKRIYQPSRLLHGRLWQSFFRAACRSAEIEV